MRALESSTVSDAPDSDEWFAAPLNPLAERTAAADKATPGVPRDAKPHTLRLIPPELWVSLAQSLHLRPCSVCRHC